MSHAIIWASIGALYLVCAIAIARVPRLRWWDADDEAEFIVLVVTAGLFMLPLALLIMAYRAFLWVDEGTSP